MGSWTAISAGIAVAFGIGLAAAPASAQPQTWKVQTSMVAGDSYYTMLQDHWLDRLAAMTGGQIKIELTPIGSVVPHTETMNAISQGILQGDFTSTTYFAGRDKVFALMGDLIAGYDTPLQLTMFCYQGGGREILQEAVDKYTGGTVQGVGCGAIAKEALVSKAKIATLADMKGKKIRSPEGLAAEVFRRAGASPVAMPPLASSTTARSLRTAVTALRFTNRCRKRSWNALASVLSSAACFATAASGGHNSLALPPSRPASAASSAATRVTCDSLTRNASRACASALWLCARRASASVSAARAASAAPRKASTSSEGVSPSVLGRSASRSPRRSLCRRVRAL